MTLDLISFFSCCFFYCRDFAVSFFHSLLKGICSFCSSIQSSFSSFSYWVKSRRLTTFPLIATHNSHETSSPLEPSPPIMTYNNEKIRDSRNLIPSNLLINDRSRKLVTVKCNRENKYSQILAHLRYVSISCSSITLWPRESLRFNRNRYLCVTEKVLPGRLHPNKFRPGLGLDFGLGLG